jgi:hypothetical protein
VLCDIFNVEGYYDEFYACLIECTNDFTWDEDKLWTVRRQYMDQIRENYVNVYTMWLSNGEVIKTGYNIIYESDYKLDIFISEGIGKYNMFKPMKIDPERLVLSLLMLIVLMYVFSLSIKPSVKLNIHNQCLNVDLESPIYINSNESECHRPPKYKVCTGDIMRSAFILESDDTFIGSVLIYNLQRKQTHEFTEFGKDTSSAVHLLVVCGTFKSKLEADVLLVEHDKGFDWNKDALVKLYTEHSGRFRWFTDSATDIWSLDDNVTLMTTLKIINEDRVLNITISEAERDNNARIPVYIDLER